MVAFRLVLPYVVVFLGCSRPADFHSNLPAQPLFRLNKLIVRNGSQVCDTIIYLYDHRNRLIQRKVQNTGRILERLEYDGNELSSLIIYDAQGNVAARNKKPMRISQGGNLMQLTYLGPGAAGSLDTNLISFFFEGELIKEIKHAVHHSDITTNISVTRHMFTYSAIHNLKKYQCIRDGTVLENRVITQTDSANNVLRSLSRMMLLFGQLPLYSALGVNNVIQYEINGVKTDIQYSYNPQGFPVTLAAKAQGTLWYEFVYSY
jgi:hypothetical protein